MSIIGFFIGLVVLAVVCWAAFWVLNQLPALLPGLPAPIFVAIRIIVVLLIVAAVVEFALGHIGGHQYITF